MNVAFRQTTIGTVGLMEYAGRIKLLVFWYDLMPHDIVQHETPVLTEAFRQLNAYLAGELRVFSLPLAPSGTPFQLRVWKILEKIPYGQTLSYGEVAGRAGNPRSARAVGMANNRNPIPIFIPCHRVIGADGKLVGYGGGMEMKAKLLAIEGRGEISE